VAPSRNYMTLQNLWQIEKMARDSRGMLTYQTPLMPWVPDLISKAERDMTHVYQFFEADRAAHGGKGYAGYGWEGSISEERAPDRLGTCDVNWRSPTSIGLMNLPKFKEEPGLWCHIIRNRVRDFEEANRTPVLKAFRKRFNFKAPGRLIYNRRRRQYNRRCPKACGVSKLEKFDYDGYGLVSGEPMLKSQPIRLLDVFVLGPLMMVAASQLPKKHRYTAAALHFFGITTILYNWNNYRRYQEVLNE